MATTNTAAQVFRQHYAALAESIRVSITYGVIKINATFLVLIIEMYIWILRTPIH